MESRDQVGGGSLRYTREGTSNKYPEMRLLRFEVADAGSAKMVFQSANPDRKRATFETGSFVSMGTNGLPYKHDICVSTAGGCTRSCTFCSAGQPSPGFDRLLTVDEICAQIEWAMSLQNPEGRYSDVVGLMGNGEPPDNPNVVPAIHEIMKLPRPVKRIMVSTIGENVRGLERLTRHFANGSQVSCPVILHFSLHAVDEDKRRTIIPGRRKLRDIMRAIDAYADAAYHPQANPYPVRVNVVLMARRQPPFSNFAVDDADRLADLLEMPSFDSGGPARRRLKLSAYNDIPGIDFEAPDRESIERFIGRLTARGIEYYSFKGSGIEIDPESGRGGFACGQLRATTGTLLDSEEVAPTKRDPGRNRRQGM